MARKKFGVEFEGFNELIDRIEKLNGDLKSVTEKALTESFKLVTPDLHQAMQKHKQTGRTEGSIVDNSTVEWNGDTASIKVGFNIKNGGLPSIFLMYGTPRIPKDQALYNAIYGKKTQEEIRKLQEEIFYEEIRRLNG